MTAAAPSTTTLVGEARPQSLRERKKARTRRELIEVSQRLFARQGYANTTLEDICAEVEIRPQTLLRYFESKAHLAMAPLIFVVDDLRRKVADPERTVPTIDLWREHVETRTHYHQMRSAADVRRYHKWSAKDPVLVAMGAALNYDTQMILASGIAADAGVDADDLHATLLAAMLVAGWNAVFIRWLRSGATTADLGTRQHAVIDIAIDTLAVGRAGEARVSG